MEKQPAYVHLCIQQRLMPPPPPHFKRCGGRFWIGARTCLICCAYATMGGPRLKNNRKSKATLVHATFLPGPLVKGNKCKTICALQQKDKELLKSTIYFIKKYHNDLPSDSNEVQVSEWIKSKIIRYALGWISGIESILEKRKNKKSIS